MPCRSDCYARLQGHGDKFTRTTRVSLRLAQMSPDSCASGRDLARIEAEKAAAAARAKEEAAHPYITLLPAWKQRQSFLRSDKEVLKHLKMELHAMEDQVLRAKEHGLVRYELTTFVMRGRSVDRVISAVSAVFSVFSVPPRSCSFPTFAPIFIPRVADAFSKEVGLLWGSVLFGRRSLCHRF